MKSNWWSDGGVHIHKTCHVCSAHPIVGAAMSCQVCPNRHYCRSCSDKDATHDRQHPMTMEHPPGLADIIRRPVSVAEKAKICPQCHGSNTHQLWLTNDYRHRCESCGAVFFPPTGIESGREWLRNPFQPKTGKSTDSSINPAMGRMEMEMTMRQGMPRPPELPGPIRK